MGTSWSPPGQAPWEALRRQRAELRESMSAVELALAAPVSRGQARWAERVQVALVELSADVRAHIAFTEGPEGLYGDILGSTPRLSGAVDRLIREHAEITEVLEDALARTLSPEGEDVDQLRALCTGLLGMLVAHRQRGSDLVYAAYELDLGGET